VPAPSAAAQRQRLFDDLQGLVLGTFPGLGPGAAAPPRPADRQRLHHLVSPLRQSVRAQCVGAVAARSPRLACAGHVQLAIDCSIVLCALPWLTEPQSLLSIAAAVAMNFALAVKHKPGRYTAF
jgi:hypothetical protein